MKVDLWAGTSARVSMPDVRGTPRPRGFMFRLLFRVLIEGRKTTARNG